MRETTIFDLLAIGLFTLGTLLQGLILLSLVWAITANEREGRFARVLGPAGLILGLLTFLSALPPEGPVFALGMGGTSAGWGALGCLAHRVIAPRGDVRAELLRVAMVWPCLVAAVGAYVVFFVDAKVDADLLRALGGTGRVCLSLAFVVGLALVAWRVGVARPRGAAEP